jgi:hypothetical protein
VFGAQLDTSLPRKLLPYCRFTSPGYLGWLNTNSGAVVGWFENPCSLATKTPMKSKIVWRVESSFFHHHPFDVTGLEIVDSAETKTLSHWTSKIKPCLDSLSEVSRQESPQIPGELQSEQFHMRGSWQPGQLPGTRGNIFVISH